MRNYCSVCRGAGYIKDNNVPWWNFWTRATCFECGGSGYQYLLYEIPWDRPKPSPAPPKPAAPLLPVHLRIMGDNERWYTALSLVIETVEDTGFDDDCLDIIKRVKDEMGFL